MAGHIVGIDFGTTNTVLTYSDPQAGPLPYIEPNGDARGVHPSVIAHETAAGRVVSRLIGWAATVWRGQRHTVEHFKLRLARCGATPAERRRNSAYQSTHEFLDALLAGFKAQHGADIAKIAVTVPEAWLSGEHQVGATAMREIFADLGYPGVKLVSEPFAAGCYFAYDFHKRRHEPYDGYLFVYDHGGGTLDLNLLRMQGANITRVAGDGFSLDISENGFGGVAFDRGVFEVVQAREPPLRRLKEAAELKWLGDFETQKRRTSANTALLLEAGRDERTVFPVQGTEVRLSDLKSVYARHFAPAIVEKVEAFLQHCKRVEPALDWTSSARFRVMTVGGFSEFCLVQDTLRRLFGRLSEGHRVLGDGVQAGEKWLSVSKGACLVARGDFETPSTSLFTFGIVSYDEGSAKPQYNAMVQEGANTALYRHTHFLERTFQLQRFGKGAHATALEFYIVRSGKPISLRHEHLISESLPDFQHASSWRFGVRVDGDRIFVEIRSNTNVPKALDMGDFTSLLKRAR